jgi:uncharacterized membrane protein YkvI
LPKNNIFPVAAAYCGAVIGAGFATGREVVEFFGVYGSRGIYGVALATALFMWAGVTILDVTHCHPVYSYLDFLHQLLRRRVLVAAADILFLGTLLAGTGVMAAAGGAILSRWGMQYTWACATFLALCVLILVRGNKGFLLANSWLAPGMAVIMALLCLARITIPAGTGFPGPYGSAFLYAAYNTAIAAVALSTLKEHLTGKTVVWGGLLGGLSLGLLLFLVYLGVAGLPGQAEIPMGELAEYFLGRGQWIYELVLLAAVLTTALANMHGLASRVAARGRYWPMLLLTAALGLAVSQYGFPSLVRLLYPLLGACNIVLLLGLCYYSFGRIRGGFRKR